MSVHVSSRVWKHCKQSGDRLLVMLSLADFSNDEGYCWPSQVTLAERTRCTERGVQKMIDGLVTDGELRIARQGGGRGRSTVYQLVRYAEIKGALGSGFTGKGEPRAERANVKTINPEQAVPPNRQGSVSRTINAPFVARLAGIFGRKETTAWSEKEMKALKKLTIDDDDLLMIERYYSACRRKSDNICRRDIFTLLNNWPGEVDRARQWCEKHPLKAMRRVNGSNGATPAPVVEDPAAHAKFREQHAAWVAAGRPLGEEQRRQYFPNEETQPA